MIKSHTFARLFTIFHDRTLDAKKTFGPFASYHEAESVIREEVTELAEAIRSGEDRRIREEAWDVATAVLRLCAQIDEVPESFSDAEIRKDLKAELHILRNRLTQFRDSAGAQVWKDRAAEIIQRLIR